MKRPYLSSIEPLEHRIAPAGLVAATLVNGLLTINAADGLDHDVEIVKTGLTTFRVTGLDTAINVQGTTSKNFSGALTGVLIEGGAGGDAFNVTNLSPLKSFVFHGNAGIDTLTTANFKTLAASHVTIDLGAGEGSVNFFGLATTLHGDLKVDLGGGGQVGFRSAVTTIDGAVTVTGGPGSDSLAITGDTTLFKNNLIFTGSDGDDSITSSGKLLTIQGLVSLDGGAGTDSFLFSTNSLIFGKSLVAGTTELKLGVGTGTVKFTGNSLHVYGDLKIDLGTGGGSAQVNSLVTTVRDTVQVTGGVGNDSLSFNGRTTIGKTLTFIGDAGADSLTAVGGLFAVKGATSIYGGFPGEAGSGGTSVDLHPVTISLTSLSVVGGIENDHVSIVSDGLISGDVNLLLGLDGTGPSSTTLQSKTGLLNGLKFGGNLTIDMVGSTVDFLAIANIHVAKSFTAQTGEGVSTVDIARANVLLDFKLQTGSGADVVNLDNINSRDFYVDTQIGADGLRIERNAAYTGISKVLGTATILTGIGADEIRIGNSIDSANTKVWFSGAMTLDSGDGANERNDVLASNFFAYAPKIISSGGGTLIQTEAI